MVNSDGCRYVGVDLLWHQSQNCCTWGLGLRYRVGRAELENGTLASCGSGLEAQCVGGGDVCRYVGVDVGLVKMASLRSLRRIFMLILLVLVIPDYLLSCILRFDY